MVFWVSFMIAPLASRKRQIARNIALMSWLHESSGTEPFDSACFPIPAADEWRKRADRPAARFREALRETTHRFPLLPRDRSRQNPKSAVPQNCPESNPYDASRSLLLTGFCLHQWRQGTGAGRRAGADREIVATLNQQRAKEEMKRAKHLLPSPSRQRGREFAEYVGTH
jgi:hypothetical protein